MERKHNGSPDLGPRRGGIAGDFERAREGTTATAEELREFMRNFRGKNPQEVLGLVAKSGLVQGVGISVVGTLIVMLTLTVIPYVWSQQAPKTGAKAAAAKPTEKPAAQAAAATPAVASGAASPATGAAGNAQQTLDKLGESETKTADPGKNPLDNLDNLLDDTK